MRNENGFTLYEVIIAVSIVGVVAFLSFPTWSHLMDKNRIELTTSKLMKMINASRQYAAGMNKPVVICPSADKEHCSDNWNSHYIIARSDDAIVSNQTLDQVVVQWQGNLSKNTKLIFGPSGKTTGQQGHFVISNVAKSQEKQIVVLMSGAIYSR